jgi:hypothetical protein
VLRLILSTGFGSQRQFFCFRTKGCLSRTHHCVCFRWRRRGAPPFPIKIAFLDLFLKLLCFGFRFATIYYRCWQVLTCWRGWKSWTLPPPLLHLRGAFPNPQYLFVSIFFSVSQWFVYCFVIVWLCFFAGNHHLPKCRHTRIISILTQPRGILCRKLERWVMYLFFLSKLSIWSLLFN